MMPSAQSPRMEVPVATYESGAAAWTSACRRRARPPRSAASGAASAAPSCTIAWPWSASVIIAAMVLFCFIGPLFYHTNQVNTNLGAVHEAPSSAHLLGTDAVGHDELGRLMLGGQSSLEVGLAAAVLAALFGTGWGAIAGFAGGWVDAIMMRIVDSFLAVPYLLFSILFLSIFPPSIPVLIIIVSLRLLADHGPAGAGRVALAADARLRADRTRGRA